MPKRSNDFQQLIKRVYEQLMPLGATVTESAMLTDAASNGRREVDVLIELPVPGLEPTRIAIECRDHIRLSDVTWIDALDGKYRDLPVDRVIAISRKPFTAGATQKAERCRIETRTLQDALETDWPDDLFDVEFTNVIHWPLVTQVGVTAVPPWPEGATPRSVRIGNAIVENTGFRLWLRERLATAFSLATQLPRTLSFTELEQPGNHVFSTVLKDPDVVLRSVDGAEHRVVELVISGDVTVEHRPLKNRRYRLGKVGVTHAKSSFDGDHLDVLAVQEQGQKLSVNITAINKRRRDP